jgi:hypothetical protein
MSDAYDRKLQDFVVDATEKLNIRNRLHTDGCYCFLSGPTYETPAECRFLRSVGGDAVGMSTVPEIIAAKHCGMKILGLSLITNKVIAEKDSNTVPASHAEVLEAVDQSGIFVQKIVTEISKKEILGDYLSSIPAFTYTPNRNAPVPASAPATNTACDDVKKSCCGTASKPKSCGGNTASAGCACGANCSCGPNCNCGSSCSCCGPKDNSKWIIAGGLAVLATGLFVFVRSRHNRLF